MKRTPIKRKTPIKRTGSLRQRSKKRQKYYREVRVPLVEKILAERPLCEAGPIIATVDDVHQCQNHSSDVHERKKRSQCGSLEDPLNLMAVCRRCHDWIDDHPTLSYDLGLLIHGWDEITPLKVDFES